MKESEAFKLFSHISLGMQLHRFADKYFYSVEDVEERLLDYRTENEELKKKVESMRNCGKGD